jgi:hypothetical protein
VLHVTARTGLGTDARFETGVVAGCSACTDFETGVVTDAEIDGKTGPPDAGSAARTDAVPVSSRYKSASVGDRPRG